MDAPPPDAPMMMPIDAKPCVAGFVNLCNGLTIRPETLSVANTVEINSGTDSRCQVKTQTGGPDLCVLYFNEVNIGTNGNLIIHGTRPVVLASATTITITGTLDVASRRSRLDKNGAGNGTCAFTTNPENDTGGGGGGAGGTMATKGGDGGIGDTNNNGGQDGTGVGGTAGALVTLPAVLRGGCNGQTGGNGDANGGAGGPSGGAVYLFAKGVIDIPGRVFASGAGGQGGGDNAGGGGAGSGGMIVIESETQSSISGLLLATGGGGGEGGQLNLDGQSGNEPSSMTAATGGAMRNEGGDGGPGATQNGANVVPAGAGEDKIGGGGGGGNGFIILRGAGRQISGNAAPLPIQPPGT